MKEADAVAAAAALLAEARRTHRSVLLPEACRPQTLEQAYVIQDRVAAQLGLRCIGFKVGAPARRVAAAEGAAVPVSGRLFEGHVHTAPTVLEAARFTCFRNCEVEFAVRLGRCLAPRAEGYTRAEVEAAVDAVIPAIEVGDSRLSDRASAGIVVVCADNAGGTELVLGAPVNDWRGLDLAARAVTLAVDGVTVAHGSGAEVMGDPLESACWLVNQRSALAEALPAGTLIATGSCTGINMVPAGAEVVAGFGALGEVRISFGAAT